MKKKILIFVDWYKPSFKAGGPIRSVHNIVNLLHEDFDFYIITSDRDLCDTAPINGIERDVWVIAGGLRVMYLSSSTFNIFRIFKIFRLIRPDVVYLNSLFSVKFSIFPMIISRFLGLKVVLAPRGMLGKGALFFKKVKKHLYINTSKILGLYNGINWHATSIRERDDIISFFGGKTRIFIAPNITTVVKSKFSNKVKNQNSVNLLFLSKITPKKNLVYIIEILQQIPDLNIHLTIAGPIENQRYWQRCLDMLKKMPESISFTITGAILHEEIEELFQSVHFLILPTFHENYGHVIVESLIFECPVIISENTPWNNLENKGVGWDIELNQKQKWIDILRRCVTMSQTEYDTMCVKSAEYAKEINNESVVNDSRMLFMR